MTFPLQRLAAETRRHKNLAVYILTATAAGTLASLSYTPATPLLPLPLALLLLFYLIWHNPLPRHIFAAGLAFAFAFFLSGLWWIFSALSGHVGLPVAAALSLTALLCLLLALFPATALLLAAWLTLPGSAMRLIVAAACLTLTEWLRSWLFTGFPWLMPGYSQIPSGWLAGWAPLLGVLGVTLILGLSVACVLILLVPRRWLQALLALVVFAAAPSLVNSAWRWVTPAGQVSVSLLQGNVPQSLKWEEEIVVQALADYLRMAEAATGRIIILPETALPMPMAALPSGYISRLRALADERLGSIVIGVFRQDEAGIYNAAVALEKNTAAEYRKVHLTPYGEYLPFADVLQPLLGAAGIPYSGLSPGDRSPPLPLVDGMYTSLSICYEILFADEWRHQLPAALFLTHITNDAWFDKTIMPHQHLRIAQARALETGRWLVRAANTGVTAVIDNDGRVVDQLPQKVRGVLTHDITLYRGATPYVLLGDSTAVLLALLLLAGGIGQRGLSAYRRWRVTRRQPAAAADK